MSQEASPPPLDAYLAVAGSLAENQRRKAEGNRQAFLAEVRAMNLIPSAPGEPSQPGSDTDDQQSRWSRMDWRDGGEDRSDHGVNEAT